MKDSGEEGPSIRIRPRPPNAGKGRPKGARNKYGQDVQRTILSALDRAGGVAYLTRQAEENPPAFMQLVGRCVPKELKAEITAELTIRQEIRRNLVDSIVELIRAQPEALEPTRPALEYEPEDAEVIEPSERIAITQTEYVEAERERALEEELKRIGPEPGSETALSRGLAGEQVKREQAEQANALAND